MEQGNRLAERNCIGLQTVVAMLALAMLVLTAIAPVSAAPNGATNVPASTSGNKLARADSRTGTTPTSSTTASSTSSTTTRPQILVIQALPHPAPRVPPQVRVTVPRLPLEITLPTLPVLQLQSGGVATHIAPANLAPASHHPAATTTGEPGNSSSGTQSANTNGNPGNPATNAQPRLANSPELFAQFTAQRHQESTQRYEAALNILKQNPQAADLKACDKNSTPDELCIPDWPNTKSPRQGIDIKRKIAYLIGNNVYPKPIPSLATPVNDVEEIARVLQQQYGYQVHVLKNATRRETVMALRKLAEEREQDESVLLFYAGHGYQSAIDGMGFWIPVDAVVQNPATWISNSDISKFLAAIPAKQVMLVSDSCFSGTLAKEQALSTTSLSRNEILGRRTVAVMSSGGEEPVSDEGKDGHSIFAWNFLRQLRDLQDHSGGYSFFDKVRQAVQTEYPQHPRYGAAIQAGHMPGGDYLLEKKR